MTYDSNTNTYYYVNNGTTATNSTAWITQGTTAATPQIVYPAYYIQPAEVKRTSKQLQITPSLKGFQVSYFDAHGGNKSSEYSEEELTKALPDLLGKLKKEPKEE